MAILRDLTQHASEVGDHTSKSFNAGVIRLANRAHKVLASPTRDAQGQEAQPVAAEGWRPIETAPRGRKLLVGYHNQLGKWRTVTAKYYPPQTLPLHDDHDWDSESDGYAAEGWYEETETHEVIMPLEVDPTHWQPLPPPPAVLSGRAESKGD